MTVGELLTLLDCGIGATCMLYMLKRDRAFVLRFLRVEKHVGLPPMPASDETP